MLTDDFDARTVAPATSGVADALQDGGHWHQLCDAILPTLDRDNALRRTYLRRRWQGNAGCAPTRVAALNDQPWMMAGARGPSRQ